MASATQKQETESAPERLRNRDRTELRLAQATLELVAEAGVLAGLNLRDVAAKAGVARGSIYKYFGNRRQLVRHALSVRLAEIDDVHGVLKRPFVERKLRLLGDETNELHSRLLALLVIDGDDEVLPMPFFDEAMDRMRSDAAAGRIHPDHATDLEAVHIATHTATRGYNVLRHAYARQLDVSVEELDERIRPVFESWLRQLAHPDPTDQPED